MKVALFIIPVIALVGVIYYVYVLLKRIADLLHMNYQHRAVKGILAAVTAVLFLLSFLLNGIGILVLLHIVVLSLLLQIFHRFFKKRKILNWLYKSSLIPVIITIVLISYGYWNMGHVVEKDYTIYTEKQIRNEGYKIAMISDLHYGISLNQKELQRYCDEISSKNPDIVVLAGDIVDENTTKDEMEEAARTLATITSNFGTYYVYGNHDRATYRKSPAFREEDLKAELENNKIHVLKDETATVNGDVSIIGRDDKGFEKDGGRKSGQDLLTNVNASNFLLMLDHQPLELEKNNELGYDLQLSGHTHNGQIWPVGIVSELIKANEMTYGYRKLSHLQIITSSGMAGWGFPVRTESHSEYVMISVQKK